MFQSFPFFCPRCRNDEDEESAGVADVGQWWQGTGSCDQSHLMFDLKEMLQNTN